MTFQSAHPGLIQVARWETTVLYHQVLVIRHRVCLVFGSVEGYSHKVRKITAKKRTRNRSAREFNMYKAKCYFERAKISY